MARKITLAAYALAENELTLINSYLSIVHLHSETKWVLSPPTSGAVTIVNTDTEEGRAFLLQHRGSEGRVFIAFSAQDPAMDELLWLPRPLRSRHFSEVLVKAEHRLSGDGPHTSPVTAECTDCGMLYQLAVSSAGKAPIFIGHKDDALIIDGRNRRCFVSSDEAVEHLAHLPQDELKVDAVDARVAASFETRNAIPIERLIWQLAKTTLTHRLDPRLPKGRTYRLARWPDLGNLGHDAHDVQLAAALSQHELDLPILRRLCAGSDETLYAFLNGCFALGYLQVCERAEEGFASEALRQLGELTDNLFGRIRSRLFAHA